MRFPDRRRQQRPAFLQNKFDIAQFLHFVAEHPVNHGQVIGGIGEADGLVRAPLVHRRFPPGFGFFNYLVSAADCDGSNYFGHLVVPSESCQLSVFSNSLFNLSLERRENWVYLSQFPSHGHVVKDPFPGFIHTQRFALIIDMGNHFLRHLPRVGRGIPFSADRLFHRGGQFRNITQS